MRAPKNKIEDSDLPPHFQTPSDFFHAFSHPESKCQLSNWLRLTVTGSYKKLPVSEKENLWAFYEHLQALVDVSAEK